MCQFLGNYRQKPRKCNKNSAEVPDDKLGRIPLPAAAWQGIDAVRLRLPLSDLWSLDAVGAFGEKGDESSFAARAHGYVGDIDGELIFGSRRAAKFYAATASMPLFDAEVHGELSVFLEPARPDIVGPDSKRGLGATGSPVVGPIYSNLIQ